MCELSRELKLCTCAAHESAEDLDHLWVFHRFDPSKNDMVIGRIRLPDTIDEKVEAHNRALLLARLNEPGAFDVDLAPRDGDRLKLQFRCMAPTAAHPSRVMTIRYGYACENGRWKEEPYDPLSWRWHHDEEKTGVIRPALEYSR